MDPALKTKWITALRSGDYAQCRMAMHDGTGYCCLGVLAKVDGLTVRNDAPSTGSNRTNNDLVYEHIRDAAVLGFYNADRCVELNDANKLSFTKIASWIEENL